MIDFFIAFLDEVGEKVRVEGVLVLDGGICTVREPVFPQRPVSLLYL